MPEVLPSHPLNRWYPIRWPGDAQPAEAFAEKYFDSAQDALEYAERRRTEITPRRVSGPISSREDPNVWAVCVEVA